MEGNNCIQDYFDEFNVERIEREKHDEDKLSALPSVSLQLISVSVLFQVLYATEDSSAFIIQGLQKCTLHIRSELVAKARQTITDLFFR